MPDNSLSSPAENEIRTFTLRRISWGAVFAGAFVALALQLLFGILGLSIGASTVNPTTQQNPFSGVGVGAGIWFVVTALISLFVGGWVAARLAGIPRRLDGTLNSIVAWSLTTLAGFYLLTTTVGSLIGGTASVLGKGLDTLAHGAGQVSSTLAQAGMSQLQESGVDLSSLKQQALASVQQAANPGTSSGVGAAGQRSGQSLQESAQNAVKNPQMAQQQVSSLIDRLLSRGDRPLDPSEKQAAVNVLVANTDMGPDQASQTVDQWEQTFQQARAKAVQLKDQAEQKARQAGEIVASGTAKAAAWTTVLLVLSLVAAGYGGYLGTPREPTAAFRA